MAALEVHGLTKGFDGAPVLREVSFELEAGGLIAILGASGGGKTTLLRLIAGFERPDSGTIRLTGEILAGGGVFKRPEQRGIGYVAQEGALFPHLSVADNITFGLPRAARRAGARVEELLAMVDLPASYANRGPATLSGGEQQRIALARALAPGPKLVLLDEPFSALDAGLRVETRGAVAAAISRAGAAAILVTHDQAEALSMGSRVGVLQSGVLSDLRGPAEFYRRPASPALARFIGEAVFCAGIAGDGSVSCALGRLDLGDAGVRGPVEIMVRPEQIKLSASAHDGVPARVDSVVFYGHDAIVRLRLPGGAEAPVTARVFSHAAPVAGSDVWLHVEGDVVAFPVGA
jgi:iron(III) transport system ATP-binding protein